MKRTAANRVTVSNLHRFLRFSPDETSRLVRHVLSRERASGWTVGVVFVPDQRMRRLHARYLGDRRTTDVLSFVYDDAGPKEGDIVVCLDQARRQAPAFGTTFSGEVARLIIHGTLHVLGYDDSRPRAQAAMKKREDLYVGEAYA